MVKTITITDEAYKRLKSLKGKNESFTDTIIKVTRTKFDITEYAGILTNKEAEKLEGSIKELWKGYDSHLKKVRDELRK